MAQVIADHGITTAAEFLNITYQGLWKLDKSGNLPRTKTMKAILNYWENHKSLAQSAKRIEKLDKMKIYRDNKKEMNK
jgi:uncharacterized membrane protein YfbV (UPF0208 family)